MNRSFRLPPVTAIAWVILLLSGCGRGGDEAPATSAAADTLRILAYNIHHGEGMDEVLDLERIAQLIADVDPDLVTLQEVDSVVTRTDGVDQAQELARLTGMQAVFGRFMAYQGGAYGMALLSRLPIQRSTNYRLPDGDEPRTALAAEVELPASGRHMRLIGIHFYRTEEERLSQAKALEGYLAEEPSMPTLLAGDFNSTPGSAVLDHLGQSWHVVDKGEDHMTFPSYGPEKEIDFFMWQPAGAFRVHGESVLDEPVISDHRPLVLDVIVESSK